MTSYDLTEEYQHLCPEMSILYKSTTGSYLAATDKWTQTATGVRHELPHIGTGNTPEEAIDALNTELKKIK